MADSSIAPRSAISGTITTRPGPRTFRNNTATGDVVSNSGIAPISLTISVTAITVALSASELRMICTCDRQCHAKFAIPALSSSIGDSRDFADAERAKDGNKNGAGPANLVEQGEYFDLRFQFFRTGFNDADRPARAASSTLPANSRRDKAAARDVRGNSRRISRIHPDWHASSLSARRRALGKRSSRIVR